MSLIDNNIQNTLTLDEPSNNGSVEIFIYDANEEKQVCDYTDVKIDYSKIDNLSPGWCMMLLFQDNLNRHIGFNRWKRYVSANFWNYLTTPINFTITLFTAISAGQTGTGSVFLSNEQLFAILFASFILSTINTFFKLKEKSEISYSIAKKYDKFGSTFEEIYYSNIKNQQDVESRLENYRTLHKEINYYVSNEDFENVDYIADLLFVCFSRICYCFITNNMKQVNSDDSFWYLDGVKNNQTKELLLNTEMLFVYDFTKVESKSNFFGLFGNKNNNHPLLAGGLVNKNKTMVFEEEGCFINENNKQCCMRINKWCNKHFMNHVRCCYNNICCCECCDEDIEKGKEIIIPNSIKELEDNV